MHRHSHSQRRGAMTLELIVSAVLLASTIGVLAPMAVHTSRLSRGARQVRLALSELANQLDRLTSLDRQQLEESLGDLVPSEQLRSALPEAKLRGQLVSDQSGTRLILSIDWERPRPAAPLALIGWIDARPVTGTQPASPGADRDSQDNLSKSKEASL